jgi:catechol-2,3-dioxygenase
MWHRSEGETTMAIHRLNHAVLYVRDVDRSVAFYRDVLGFRRIEDMGGVPGAAFLRAAGSTNDHDLGLFQIGAQAGDSQAGRATVGLYHLAWEVDTLADLEELAGRLASADALVGASDHSTTKSLYGKDPDGLEFEVAWIVPAEALDDFALAGRDRIRPLDLGAEKERYGASTRGGVGVSRVLA